MMNLRKSYIQMFEERVEICSKEIRECLIKGATEDQLRDLDITLGSQLELFLKKAVFPNITTSPGLSFLIDELDKLGVSKNVRDDLHKCRVGYNSSKHSAHHHQSITATKNNILAIVTFLNLIKKVPNLSGLHVLSPLATSSVYWGFVWDHYIGGDSEVSIFIPSLDENPFAVPCIDTIYIKIEAWDDFKREIQKFGHFSTKKEDIQNEALYNLMSHEGDFLSAFSFEGKFSDLIKVLSRFELRQELLPGLNRADNHYVVFQSLVLSALEAIKTFHSRLAEDEIEKRIRGMAKNLFAVPDDTMLNKFSEYLVSMFKVIDFDSWMLLEGPIWLKFNEFNELKSEAIYQTDLLIVRSDYTIILGF